MSADDVPQEFLDKLEEDGLYEDEVQDELEAHDLEGSPGQAMADLKALGYGVEEELREDGLYFSIDSLEPEYDHVETKRMGTSHKAKVTRDVNDYLEKKEREITGRRKEMDFDWQSYDWQDGAVDQIVHFSDNHFGDVVKSPDGEVIYDSEKAYGALLRHAGGALEAARQREEEVENVTILLGGDHVTNEAIYSEQPHDIDATIDEQLDMATAGFMDVIDAYSDEYEHVQVVCQGGNHGEFRVKGSSKHANADDLMFDQLEMMVARSQERYGDMDNVSFVKSDRSDHVNFDIRGGKGHLRHGDNVNNHIGTSSPQSTWGAFLSEYDFDLAFRGHYHKHTEEQISGRPVFMAPSPKPADEFAGSIGEFSDDSLIGYTIFVDDEARVIDKDYVRADDGPKV